MTDPDDSAGLTRADLAETEIDAADDLEWPLPLEADPADAFEQQQPVEDDGEDYRDG